MSKQTVKITMYATDSVKKVRGAMCMQFVGCWESPDGPAYFDVFVAGFDGGSDHEAERDLADALADNVGAELVFPRRGGKR